MNIRAAALNTPVSVMETAGEGGAWGMALLASYMVHKKDGETYVETECSHLLLGERYPLIFPNLHPLHLKLRFHNLCFDLVVSLF